jgi:hypothetical protein
MKKIIGVCLLVFFVAACNQKSKNIDNVTRKAGETEYWVVWDREGEHVLLKTLIKKEALTYYASYKNNHGMYILIFSENTVFKITGEAIENIR